MAAHRSANDDEIVAAINMTPLVDIVLVLLVIFMVTAKVISEQSVPLDLPKAASATTVQTVLTVSLDQRGQVYVDGRALSGDAELRSVANSKNRQNPQLRTVLRAAGKANHASVLHVLDELRQAGITSIAFAAEPAAEP
ncbi:MAG: biopolymer transporter ExbD [Myxococcales bacterium]|nr:biopolymer transporter ExbD [Myxococcales bacterium]